MNIGKLTDAELDKRISHHRVNMDALLAEKNRRWQKQWDTVQAPRRYAQARNKALMDWLHDDADQRTKGEMYADFEREHGTAPPRGVLTVRRVLTVSTLIVLSACGSTGVPDPQGEVYLKLQELRVSAEARCSEYDRGDYRYPQELEQQIVARMGGRLYAPYTGTTYTSTDETQIEHMVALSEAHDSGLCAASAGRRRGFAKRSRQPHPGFARGEPREGRQRQSPSGRRRSTGAGSPRPPSRCATSTT